MTVSACVCLLCYLLTPPRPCKILLHTRFIVEVQSKMSKGKGKAPEPVPVAEAAPVEPEVIPQGTGEFVLPDGSSYFGEWKELNKVKVRDGLGTMTFGPETYVGQWAGDKMNGEGEYTFASGGKYKGHFKDNLFEGEGEYIFPDGAIYSGHWHNNKMHGKGIYTDKDKIEFKGMFVNGMFDSGKSYVSVRNS